ncbi:MAG: hypothetical protein RBT49_09620 [Bacteroidales bacterium]|nr:hypothetical protein [Bacteroidales bacterium]
MNIISFILLLMIFTACQPVKQISESKQTSDSFNKETAESIVTGKLDEKQSSDQKVNIFTDIVNQVDESSLIVITEFDTSKPVDPGTGKPPPIKETIIDNSKKSSSTNKTVINSSERGDKQLITDIKSDENTAKESSNQTTDEQTIIIEKELTWYQVLFIRAGQLFLFLITCSIFIICWRFFPNWTKFLKRLF